MGVSHMSNPSEQGSRRWSRRGILTASGAVPAAALTGCGSGSADAAQGPGTRAAAATGASAAAEQPVISVSPADGTGKAAFTSPVVTVADGTLASVRVTGDDGATLEGSLNDAQTRWTSAKNPYSGTTYTVTARAEGADAARTATFTTRSPGETFVGCFTPEADSTSGVGMPVSIDFSRAVSDRAAAQKAITVTTEPAVEIFVHGTCWSSTSVFGSRNTSHGRVGLHDAKGADAPSVAGYRFYESSMLGDVVIVKNSGERTVDPANGLNGWNMSWADWKAGSAV